MNRTNAAYIAGLIDGEGTIGVFLSRSPSRANYAVLARVRIAVCDEALIRWLHSTTGSGTVISWQPRPAHHKRVWGVIWNGYAAADLIVQVRRFLRLKRAQADLVVAWVKISKRWQHKLGGRGRRDRKYPDQVWRQAEAIGARIRELNRKGSSA